jgi:hypothetical protein
MFDWKAVACDLLAELDHTYDQLMRGHRKELEARWVCQLGLIGRDVLAETFDGTRIRGRLSELCFDSMRLERSDGSCELLLPEQVKSLAASAT